MAYGLDIKSAGGVSLVSSLGGFLNLIWQQKFDHDFDGTVSVPEFDDQEGMIMVQPIATYGKSGSRDDDPPDPLSSVSYSDRQSYSHFASPQSLPDVSWNNTTKILTITPFDLPSGWPLADPKPRTLISLIRVQNRVDIS